MSSTETTKLTVQMSIRSVCVVTTNRPKSYVRRCFTAQCGLVPDVQHYATSYSIHISLLLSP